MSKLFPIMLEVEEPALGTVLRTLNGMPGIAKLHLDLEGAPKKNGKGSAGPGHGRYKRGHDGPTGSEVLIAALMSGPKNLNFLADALTSAGLAKSGLHGALNQLRQKGITESAGVGIHKLTDRAMREMQKNVTPALPPPEPAAGKRWGHAPGRKPIVKSERKASDIILDELTNKGPLNRPAIIETLVDNGFSDRTADNNLKLLRNAKKIKLIGDGLYEAVTPKAKAAAKAPAKNTPTRSGATFNDTQRIVLKKLKDAGGTASIEELIEAVVAGGKAPGTIKGPVAKLVDTGMVTRPKRGNYQLTDKGAKAESAASNQ